MGGFGDNGDGRTLQLLDGHRLNAFDLSPFELVLHTSQWSLLK